MPHVLPEPAQLLAAIELYLKCAYEGAPPATVTTVVQSLGAGGGEMYQAKSFVRDGAADRQRLLLRLGNRHYPHMKLVLEPAPGAEFYLYRADTHDRHICPPPGHPEYAAFRELRNQNQAIGECIENSWAKAGIPTFKTFLQQDLARRQARGVSS